MDYTTRVNRLADAIMALGALFGTGMVNKGWLTVGWMVSIFCVCVLFQRTRQLDKH